MFIGAGIASASLLFLLLTIVYTALTLIYAGSEEHICLEKYGDAYREYMEKTPRWIGLPKS
jgi:protein-S-isoprenylcysteine O-methyltransferase Ste14